jgi:hypothetical protein
MGAENGLGRDSDYRVFLLCFDRHFFRFKETAFGKGRKALNCPTCQPRIVEIGLAYWARGKVFSHGTRFLRYVATLDCFSDLSCSQILHLRLCYRQPFTDQRVTCAYEPNS